MNFRVHFSEIVFMPDDRKKSRTKSEKKDRKDLKDLKDSRDRKEAGRGSRVGASTLEKGLTVLEAVEKAGEPVTIREVAVRTGIQRLAVYRLLSTLEERGYVRRLEDKRYRATFGRRRVLVGYAAPLTGTPFRAELAASIERAAAQAGVELVMLGNQEDDAVTALANAATLLDRRVDVAILFQPRESLGHLVADRFFNAGTTFITVEHPIQGGVYYGANNFQAGKLGGQVLGRFATEAWEGRFDLLVLLEAGFAGTSVQARVTGALAGARELVGDIPDSKLIHLEGEAHRESSREAVAALLRKLPPGRRLLVSGFNDPSAVGAVEAVRAAGRERDTAVVGQNATREGRTEIRRKRSCFIASVAYFPERYGPRLLDLASAIARKDPVPPAVYTEHLVLDRNNVDEVYPDEE
ncbi:MAG: hypothetical protein EHM61_07645 [Acidobacteria bacterium]|nr:MAG: hypothetical protein EHM61_07645 [Acidobacteriota bacterium]